MSEDSGISAVLIVKNEEKVLERCVKSLAGVDEVIICDTGSTDQTFALANSLSRKVYKRTAPKPFHFAEARNDAMTFATHPWVLSMDADEVLREGTLRHLRSAVRRESKATAFLCDFLDRGMKTVKRKLFLKAAWRWKYRVHELLEPTREPLVKTAFQAEIEHLPEEDKSVRHAQNIDLLKLAIEESPEHLIAWRALGQELMIQGQHDDALYYLAYFADKSANVFDLIERSQVICYMAQCMLRKDQLEKAVKLWEGAHQVAPNRREPLFWAARALYEAGHLKAASRRLKRLLAIPAKDKPGSRLDEAGVWDDTPAKILADVEAQIAAGVTPDP
jgi:glycosyltransferase involved in cell wall biosynthesis